MVAGSIVVAGVAIFLVFDDCDNRAGIGAANQQHAGAAFQRPLDHEDCKTNTRQSISSRQSAPRGSCRFARRW
jgi:hypothetical protein